MGFITDLLKDVPLSTVLRERLAIADKETETFKSKIANFEQLSLQKDQEIERLCQTIQELQKSHSLPPLKFITPFYFADGDPAPFCPTCWEVNKIQIHLSVPSRSSVGPKYTCTHCNNSIVHPRTKSNLPINSIRV